MGWGIAAFISSTWRHSFGKCYQSSKMDQKQEMIILWFGGMMDPRPR